MTFAQICSLEESAPVAETHIWSVDFGQSDLTDFMENRVVNDEYKLFFQLQTMIPSNWMI